MMFYQEQGFSDLGKLHYFCLLESVLSTTMSLLPLYQTLLWLPFPSSSSLLSVNGITLYPIPSRNL